MRSLLTDCIKYYNPQGMYSQEVSVFASPPYEKRYKSERNCIEPPSPTTTDPLERDLARSRTYLYQQLLAICDLRWEQGLPTTMSLFFNVIFIFAFVVVVNFWLARFSPHLALTQGELLTLYAMLSIASAIGGTYSK